MKKLKAIIVLIVCLTIFLLLLPIAIRLATAIHRYVVPVGSVEPRHIAKMYMRDNPELENFFGENYKYIYLDMDWETKDNGEKTSTVTFFVWGYGKYTIYLELQGKEWVIIHSE